MTPRPGKGQSEISGELAEEWTIGDLAAELEVTPRTLRFYESEGLIAPLRRSAGRRYTRRDRARMQLILRGRRFGMSLPEIREILDMYDGASGDKVRQLETVVTRISQIRGDLTIKQRDIMNTLDELAEVSTRCQVRLDELRQKAVAHD